MVQFSRIWPPVVFAAAKHYHLHVRVPSGSLVSVISRTPVPIIWTQREAGFYVGTEFTIRNSNGF